MDLFRKFILFFLSIQEKSLTNNLKNTISIRNNSNRKSFFSNGCCLNLETLANEEKEKFENELSLILKKMNYDTDKILTYIKSQGTNIFYIDNEKSINSIGENTGFIYPQTGLKAIALSILTKQNLKFNTKEMFILTKNEVNKYYFIYHFYNWYAFKQNIRGIDAKTLNLLNKSLYSSSDEEISKLQLADIYRLKDAIKQDKSAIEFVFKLCQAKEGTKKALEKLKQDGANL